MTCSCDYKACQPRGSMHKANAANNRRMYMYNVHMYLCIYVSRYVGR